MSLFARALSGAAQGVAQVTNKWIDEDIAQQRAQFIAELQRTTATNIRNDQAAFDDARAPVLQERELGRAKALARTQREIELEALNDKPLQDAKTARADADADAEIRRKLRAGEKLLPFEQKRARALADADAGARAKYRDAPPSLKAKIDELQSIVGPLTQEQLLRVVGLGTQPDKPLGKEIVETTTPDGLTKTTRETPIMAGSAPQGQQADPIKAAMDAARAAQQKKPAAQAPQKPEAGTAKPAEPIQLLDPLYKLNELRRRMQQQSEGL